MKKKLLPFLALGFTSLMAQTQSPDWTTIQNTNFPLPSAGVRYLDAVDANVVWATGYDGMTPSRNYNWFTNSIDGGTTFTSGNVFPDTNTYVIAALEGADATTAYVTAYVKSTGNKGVVYKTTNSGALWANIAAVNMYTASASFANITCFTDPPCAYSLVKAQLFPCFGFTLNRNCEAVLFYRNNFNVCLD